MTCKTVLTPNVHERIVRALRKGAFGKTAANLAGVRDSVFREWLAKGATGQEPYATFAADCDAAQAKSLMLLQGVVRRAARKGDWKAAAWLLERRHPMLYSARAHAALTNEPQSQDARPQSPWLTPAPAPNTPVQPNQLPPLMQPAPAQPAQPYSA